jgi:exopolysaccharide/PEP-CTERM locus tyrosine autokinase
MSSLIEQAAKRLEQLREAGVEVPEAAPRAVATASGATVIAAERAPQAPAFEDSTSAALSAHTSRRVTLDPAALESAGIITPNAPRSQLADQYRVIKRPLIGNATGKGAAVLKHGNLIMVTSAMAGEGKSFTAVNLAMSIAAERDHTVMLVDADVARPSVPRMLGLEPAAGLLDVLQGTVEMSDVLLRTDIEKLTVLPSGTPHPRATELLASEAMERLLSDMAERYADRIVIFDSPPLLLTTEARVLASHMGQIVVVVQANKTLQSDVEHALSTIEACPVRLMLLNQARARTEGSRAYGPYGYGYGSEYGYARETPQAT